MITLENPKHERFAQAVARGASAGAAYKTIYKASGSAAANSASRLLGKPAVASRILELQKLSAADTVMTLREYREFLAKVVRTAGGELDGSSPVAQVELKFSGSGRDKCTGMKIKGISKLACLILDSKLSGLMPEQQPAPEVGNDDLVISRELLTRLQERRAELLAMNQPQLGNQ